MDLHQPDYSTVKRALDGLNKKELYSLKAFIKPPPAAKKVLLAVLCMLKKPRTWEQAKLEMKNPNTFVENLHVVKN